MSQLTPRRINVEDLKGAPSWAPPLVSVLNLFFEDVIRTVNGRLQLNDNVSGMVFTATVTTPADYATGGFPPVSFNYTGKLQPSCVLIGNISCTKPAEAILTPTSLQWSYNNSVSPNQVRIDYVAGLKPSQTYSITFLCL